MQWSEKDLFAVELFEPSGEEPATQRPRLPGGIVPLPISTPMRLPIT